MKERADWRVPEDQPRFGVLFFVLTDKLARDGARFVRATLRAGSGPNWFARRPGTLPAKGTMGASARLAITSSTWAMKRLRLRKRHVGSFEPDAFTKHELTGPGARELASRAWWPNKV